MRTIEVNGVDLAVDDRGEGEAVVLLHGFPEFSFSWRHQVPALVDAGYRVINLDQRGYGGSGTLPNIEDYALHHLSADVVGVLDRLGIESATVVGHDWGSIVAYTAAIEHADRFDRVVSLNVPYRGACWGFPTTDMIRDRLAERFSYVLMFQDGHRAEDGFAANPAGWLMAFYSGGSRGRTFLTDEELETFVDAFRSSGITGPVNWYRNIDANAEHFAPLLHAPLTQPTLLIAADSDPVLPLSLTEGLGEWCEDLTKVVVEDCGHWTQQERPDDVNKALIEWLDATG